MSNLDYGIVGNGRSAALISKTGCVDWLCLPDFSSSSVFAAVLDETRGGHFRIDTAAQATVTQSYVKHTCILRTRYETADGVFEVLDFMPRYRNDRGHYVCPSDLVRFVRLISGKPTIRVDYRPAVCYAQYPTKTVKDGPCLKSWSSKGKYESVYLYTDLPDEVILEGREHTLTGDCFFLLSYNQKLPRLDVETVELELQRTKVYWMDWVQRTVSFAEYREEIIRSALVLKLLSYQKTGAILAAATTSLPETIGETRNWDYRFCWIRDASMMIRVLADIGHHNTAKRFLQFIIDIVPYKDEKIQIMYGIRGEKRLTERTLPWLRGYEGSSPVRVGNAAYKQKQNDIYGVLLDVIYESFARFGNDVEHCEELWTVARSLVRTVSSNWRKPDQGIWEFRQHSRHFVFSKVLSWVAMDRGVELARMLQKDSYVARWSRVRDRIRDDIHLHGWHEELGAFTQSYGSDAMDASNLLMATYGFIDPKDPRFVSTVKRTWEELGRNGLMYRYRQADDFGEPSSAFTVCSFWLVKALCQIGCRDEAHELFDSLLQCANHVGLFSEDLDFESKRLLGNFPQGYSHLALIDAAIALSETRVDDNEALLSQLEQPQTIPGG